MANTSSRTLRLLSLLQTHRFWPGPELADRLEAEGYDKYVKAAAQA